MEANTNGVEPGTDARRATRIKEVAGLLVEELLAAGKSLATAESCTGGWIAQAVTAIPGSSGCFGYGIVSYSDLAKEKLLGVDERLLREHGAVSEETVRQMAQGVLSLSGADFAVAVSGIAGPGGGSAKKPVGTVWMAWASRSGNDMDVRTALHHLGGGRDAIRRESVVLVLQGLRETVDTNV